MNIKDNEEQIYLDKTMDIIKKEISKQEDTCESGIEYIQELSKYHWENKETMDDIEFANSVHFINHSALLTNNQIDRLRKLRRSLKNPFFGKIEVDFDDDEVESIYIGFTNIMDSYDQVVSDWRSPIATLFYNSKLGNTHYDVPMGRIDCKLLNRKQIKISNGKIERVVESDIHLGDDELQEVLSKSSDGKMKNIVTTIQEEQNNVIRNVKDKKLIVQGCAGSGKTSVALHRLAFLLFNDKKSNSSNMLILSPSDTFSKYISNVLPDLGESNVMETTFSDFANAFINRFDKIESYTEFVSKYYDELNSEGENKLNKFKFSSLYKDAIQKFIVKETDTYRFNNNVIIGDVIIPYGVLNTLLASSAYKNFGLQERLDLLADDVKTLSKKYANFNSNSIRKVLEKELINKRVDPRILYNRFLESDEFREAYGKKGNKLNKKLLSYADLSGMLYLYFEIVGYPDNNIIHHLVIDEAQDYSPIQVEMISKMFKGASITLLGDCNQTINPYHKYKSLKEMQDIIKDSKYVELNKAYRSSPEIMNYVSKIIDDDKIIPVRNSNNKEIKVKEVSKDELYKKLVSDLLTLKENGAKRICIITKSTKESKAIFDTLKDTVDDLTVINENNDLTDTCISPSYLAKGLEFDAVILYNDIENTYNSEDKYLYYVACTRAQHDLIIYNEPDDIKKKVLR